MIDGRGAIASEIASAPLELRSFLSGVAGELLAERRFMDALPGYLLPDEMSQQRLGRVLGTLKAIAEMRRGNPPMLLWSEILSLGNRAA